MNYLVSADVEVAVTVSNPDAIERVTGPAGDEWRAQFYKLHTVEDVLSHWTYNAIVNGVEDVRRLDGWADLAEDDVTISVEIVDADVREQVKEDGRS